MANIFRYVRGPQLSVTLTAGATIGAGMPLKWSAGTVVPVTAAGDSVMGIAEEDAASGASVSVFIAPGATFAATVAASATTITPGTRVWAAAPSSTNHFVVSDTGTGNPAANKICCGVALGTAAAGAELEFQFFPEAATTNTTGVQTISA